MRTIFSFAAVLALSSCSAIDNFGKFTVGTASDDMAGGAGCTPGCDCIPADSTLGIPAHCRVAPLGGFDCLTSVRAGADVEVPAGNYTLDSAASPPTLTDGMGTLIMSGTVSGSSALFCVGSLTIDTGAHVTLTGNRAVAIVADSLIHQQNGSWTLGGGYANDTNGAAGVAGGTNGGSGANAGDGASGAPAATARPAPAAAAAATSRPARPAARRWAASCPPAASQRRARWPASAAAAAARARCSAAAAAVAAACCS